MRILSVVAAIVFSGAPAWACNAHPPDVSHDRWLAQIAQWNKEYDAKQAAKAQEAAGRETRGRDRGRRDESDMPAPMARGGGDPQVRSLGRQPQSTAAPVGGGRDRRYR